MARRGFNGNTQTIRVRPRKETPISTEQAQLVILVGPGSGCCYPLDRKTTTVGRTGESTIALDSNDVSRQHAEIAMDGRGRYLLKDLASKNGTMVNGVPIREHALKFGDKIRIGRDTVMIFNSFDRAEEALLRAQRLETVGEIAATVAHDFNNILAAIRANLEYLRVVLPRSSRLDEPKVAEVLSDSDQAIDRAVQLARQLGGLALDRKAFHAVDLAAIVDEVARLMQHTLGDAVTIKVKSAGQPVVTTGDPGQLHQLLTNLCVNARDAMPDGGSLTLSLDTVALGTGDNAAPLLERGDYARLEVRDTGVGMIEEVKARAFEPLFSTKEDRGTGLGLATVYNIVKKHGGAVTLDSEVGQGTTVKVLLPLKRP